MENQSSKSVHVNFLLRPQYCPLISMNNSVIPHVSQDKYLGFILDRRLTWGPPHLKDMHKKQISILHLLRPLLRSKINLKNKLLLYKSTLPYMDLRYLILRSSQQKDAKTIQAFQSICLRTIAKTPWFVTNKLLHDEFHIKSIL